MAESRVGKNLAICQWGTSFYRVSQYSTLLILAELSYYYYSWVNLVINSRSNKREKCCGCRLHQSWLKLLWSLFLSSTSHSSWLPSISQSWHLALLPLSLLVWPQHSCCFFFCTYYDTNYFLVLSCIFNYFLNCEYLCSKVLIGCLRLVQCSLLVGCLHTLLCRFAQCSNRPNDALASTLDLIILDNADLYKLMRT